VLVDISQPSDALEWELSQCIERMPDRTILLAVEDQREMVESWIESGGHVHAALRALPLFVHRKGRIAGEEAFRSLAAERLVATRYPSQPASFLSTCASAALLKVSQLSVIDTMLGAGDPLTTVRAAVALAVHDDGEAVSVALEASRVVEMKWLVRKTYPHEQMVLAAIENLMTAPRARAPCRSLWSAARNSRYRFLLR